MPISCRTPFLWTTAPTITPPSHEWLLLSSDWWIPGHIMNDEILASHWSAHEWLLLSWPNLIGTYQRIQTLQKEKPVSRTRSCSSSCHNRSHIVCKLNTLHSPPCPPSRAAWWSTDSPCSCQDFFWTESWINTIESIPKTELLPSVQIMSFHCHQLCCWCTSPYCCSKCHEDPLASSVVTQRTLFEQGSIWSKREGSSDSQ